MQFIGFVHNVQRMKGNKRLTQLKCCAIELTFSSFCLYFFCSNSKNHFHFFSAVQPTKMQTITISNMEKTRDTNRNTSLVRFTSKLHWPNEAEIDKVLHVCSYFSRDKIAISYESNVLYHVQKMNCETKNKKYLRIKPKYKFKNQRMSRTADGQQQQRRIPRIFFWRKTIPQK